MKQAFKSRVAAITLTAFLITQVFGLAPEALALSPELSSDIAAASRLELSVPREIARIQHLHQGQGPLLLHIQTAHGHYEAQKKIESLLTYLRKNYGIRDVFVEGNAVQLNPQILNFFPQDSELNRAVLDRLTEKAYVKGAELFAVDHPDVSLYGIEKLEAYRADKAAFRKVLRDQSKTLAFARDMDQKIKNLTGPHLNPALREFIRRQEASQKETLEFTAWLSYLKNQARRHLSLDLESPEFQLDWPMLVRVFALQKMEKQLEAGKLEAEKKEFLSAIKRFLGMRVRGLASEREEADTRTPAHPHTRTLSLYAQIESLLNQPQGEETLSDPDMRLLFEQMIQTLPANFNYGKFPQTRALIGHLILQSELKSEILFQELETLQKKLADVLAQTPEEKQIYEALQQHRLLQKLLNLELTAEEYETISVKRQALSDKENKEALNAYRLPLTADSADIHPSSIVERLCEISTLKGIRSTRFDHLREMDALYQHALEFYAGAKERDQWMLQNVERTMKEKGIAKAAVITGGFHAEPFKRYFEQKNFNFAALSPKLTSAGSREPYVQAVLNTDPKLTTGTMEMDSIAVRPVQLIQHDTRPAAVWGVIRQSIREGAKRLGRNLEKVEQDFSRSLFAQLYTPQDLRSEMRTEGERLHFDNPLGRNIFLSQPQGTELIRRILPPGASGTIFYIPPGISLRPEDVEERRVTHQMDGSIEIDLDPLAKLGGHHNFVAGEDGSITLIHWIFGDGKVIEELERRFGGIGNVDQLVPVSNQPAVRSEMRVTVSKVEPSKKYGTIYRINNPVNQVSLDVAPDYFGHLTSLSVQGQEFLYPARGSWFMFPWAGLLHAPGKKITLPDGTVIDLSERRDLAWKPQDRIGHGFSRLPVAFKPMPMISPSGPEALMLELETTDVPGMPAYYHDLKVRRFFVVRGNEVWIFTQIQNFSDTTKVLSFGDHHVFNTPDRDQWQADRIPANKRWEKGELDLPARTVWIHEDPLYDFRYGKFLEGADYDVTLTHLELNQAPYEPPQNAFWFSDFPSLLSNPYTQSHNRPYVTSILRGPKGEIIRLDQDATVYKQIVFWAPRENGSASDFIGLEPQTSSANILNTADNSEATPVILGPRQSLTTWNRITIQPARPAGGRSEVRNQEDHLADRTRNGKSMDWAVIKRQTVLLKGDHVRRGQREFTVQGISGDLVSLQLARNGKGNGSARSARAIHRRKLNNNEWFRPGIRRSGVRDDQQVMSRSPSAAAGKAFFVFPGLDGRAVNLAIDSPAEDQTGKRSELRKPVDFTVHFEPPSAPPLEVTDETGDFIWEEMLLRLDHPDVQTALRTLTVETQKLIRKMALAVQGFDEKTSTAIFQTVETLNLADPQLRPRLIVRKIKGFDQAPGIPALAFDVSLLPAILQGRQSLLIFDFSGSMNQNAENPPGVYGSYLQARSQKDDEVLARVGLKRIDTGVMSSVSIIAPDAEMFPQIDWIERNAHFRFSFPASDKRSEIRAKGSLQDQSGRTEIISDKNEFLNAVRAAVDTAIENIGLRPGDVDQERSNRKVLLETIAEEIRRKFLSDSRLHKFLSQQGQTSRDAFLAAIRKSDYSPQMQELLASFAAVVEIPQRPEIRRKSWPVTVRGKKLNLSSDPFGIQLKVAGQKTQLIQSASRLAARLRQILNLSQEQIEAMTNVGPVPEIWLDEGRDDSQVYRVAWNNPEALAQALRIAFGELRRSEVRARRMGEILDRHQFDPSQEPPERKNSVVRKRLPNMSDRSRIVLPAADFDPGLLEKYRRSGRDLSNFSWPDIHPGDFLFLDPNRSGSIKRVAEIQRNGKGPELSLASWEGGRMFMSIPEPFLFRDLKTQGSTLFISAEHLKQLTPSMTSDAPAANVMPVLQPGTLWIDGQSQKFPAGLISGTLAQLLAEFNRKSGGPLLDAGQIKSIQVDRELFHNDQPADWAAILEDETFHVRTQGVRITTRRSEVRDSTALWAVSGGAAALIGGTVFYARKIVRPSIRRHLEFAGIKLQEAERTQLQKNLKDAIASATRAEKLYKRWKWLLGKTSLKEKIQTVFDHAISTASRMPNRQDDIGTADAQPQKRLAVKRSEIRSGVMHRRVGAALGLAGTGAMAAGWWNLHIPFIILTGTAAWLMFSTGFYKDTPSFWRAAFEALIFALTGSFAAWVWNLPGFGIALAGVGFAWFASVAMLLEPLQMPAAEHAVPEENPISPPPPQTSQTSVPASEPLASKPPKPKAEPVQFGLGGTKTFPNGESFKVSAIHLDTNTTELELLDKDQKPVRIQTLELQESFDFADTKITLRGVGKQRQDPIVLLAFTDQKPGASDVTAEPEASQSPLGVSFNQRSEVRNPTSPFWAFKGTRAEVQGQVADELAEVSRRIDPVSLQIHAPRLQALQDELKTGGTPKDPLRVYPQHSGGFVIEQNGKKRRSRSEVRAQAKESVSKTFLERELAHARMAYDPHRETYRLSKDRSSFEVQVLHWTEWLLNALRQETSGLEISLPELQEKILSLSGQIHQSSVREKVYADLAGLVAEDPASRLVKALNLLFTNDSYGKWEKRFLTWPKPHAVFTSFDSQNLKGWSSEDVEKGYRFWKNPEALSEIHLDVITGRPVWRRPENQKILAEAVKKLAASVYVFGKWDPLLRYVFFYFLYLRTLPDLVKDYLNDYPSGVLVSEESVLRSELRRSQDEDENWDVFRLKPAAIGMSLLAGVIWAIVHHFGWKTLLSLAALGATAVGVTSLLSYLRQEEMPGEVVSAGETKVLPDFTAFRVLTVSVSPLKIKISLFNKTGLPLGKGIEIGDDPLPHFFEIGNYRVTLLSPWAQKWRKGIRVSIAQRSEMRSQTPEIEIHSLNDFNEMMRPWLYRDRASVPAEKNADKSVIHTGYSTDQFTDGAFLKEKKRLVIAKAVFQLAQGGLIYPRNGRTVADIFPGSSFDHAAVVLGVGEFLGFWKIDRSEPDPQEWRLLDIQFQALGLPGPRIFKTAKPISFSEIDSAMDEAKAKLKISQLSFVVYVYEDGHSEPWFTEWGSWDDVKWLAQIPADDRTLQGYFDLQVEAYDADRVTVILRPVVKPQPVKDVQTPFKIYQAVARWVTQDRSRFESVEVTPVMARYALPSILTSGDHVVRKQKTESDTDISWNMIYGLQWRKSDNTALITLSPHEPWRPEWWPLAIIHARPASTLLMMSEGHGHSEFPFPIRKILLYNDHPLFVFDPKDTSAIFADKYVSPRLREAINGPWVISEDDPLLRNVLPVLYDADHPDAELLPVRKPDDQPGVFKAAASKTSLEKFLTLFGVDGQKDGSLIYFELPTESSAGYGLIYRQNGEKFWLDLGWVQHERKAILWAIREISISLPSRQRLLHEGMSYRDLMGVRGLELNDDQARALAIAGEILGLWRAEWDARDRSYTLTRFSPEARTLAAAQTENQPSIPAAVTVRASSAHKPVETPKPIELLNPQPPRSFPSPQPASPVTAAVRTVQTPVRIQQAPSYQIVEIVFTVSEIDAGKDVRKLVAQEVNRQKIAALIRQKLEAEGLKGPVAPDAFVSFAKGKNNFASSQAGRERAAAGEPIVFRYRVPAAETQRSELRASALHGKEMPGPESFPADPVGGFVTHQFFFEGAPSIHVVREARGMVKRAVTEEIREIALNRSTLSWNFLVRLLTLSDNAAVREILELPDLELKLGFLTLGNSQTDGERLPPYLELSQPGQPRRFFIVLQKPGVMSQDAGQASPLGLLSIPAHEQSMLAADADWDSKALTLRLPANIIPAELRNETIPGRSELRRFASGKKWMNAVLQFSPLQWVVKNSKLNTPLVLAATGVMFFVLLWLSNQDNRAILRVFPDAVRWHSIAQMKEQMGKGKNVQLIHYRRGSPTSDSMELWTLLFADDGTPWVFNGTEIRRLLESNVWYYAYFRESHEADEIALIKIRPGLALKEGDQICSSSESGFYTVEAPLPAGGDAVVLRKGDLRILSSQRVLEQTFYKKIPRSLRSAADSLRAGLSSHPHPASQRSEIRGEGREKSQGEIALENAQRQLKEVARKIKLDQRLVKVLLGFFKITEVEIPIRMDSGKIKVFKGYRVFHNDVLGAGKGGTRFDPDVNLEEVKALSMWMSIKNAIANLPFGGAKGGIEVDPKELSLGERARLTRGYVRALLEKDPEAIGPLSDIPAPDLGTNDQVMAWIADEYLKIKYPHLFSEKDKAKFKDAQDTAAPYLEAYVTDLNHSKNNMVQGSPHGVVTSKPEDLGGSLGRRAATGRGVYWITIEALKAFGERLGIGTSLKDKRIAVEGYGNVGKYAAQFMAESGAKIVSLRDIHGAIYSEEGIDLAALDEHLQIKENTLITFAAAYPGKVKLISSDEFWASQVDILVPAARENTITEDNAKLIRAKMIVEGANGPVKNRAAEEILEKKKILIVPDVLANAGGVIGSFMEWHQNNVHEQWVEEMVNLRIKDRLLRSFHNVTAISEGMKISLRQAAYVYAVTHIVDAELARDPDLAKLFSPEHPPYHLHNGLRRWRPDTWNQLNQVKGPLEKRGLIARADLPQQERIIQVVESMRKRLPVTGGGVIRLGGVRASGKHVVAERIKAELEKQGYKIKIFDLEYQDPEQAPGVIARLLEGQTVTEIKEDGQRQDFHLAPDETLMLVGLDVLSDSVLKAVGDRPTYGLFFFSSPDLLLPNHSLLAGYDIRLMRDILASLAVGTEHTVEDVIERWDGQRLDETDRVFRTAKNADAAFDTYLPYELPILVTLLLPAIEEKYQKVLASERKDAAFVLNVLKRLRMILLSVEGWELSTLEGSDSLLAEFVSRYTRPGRSKTNGRISSPAVSAAAPANGNGSKHSRNHHAVRSGRVRGRGFMARHIPAHQTVFRRSEVRQGPDVDSSIATQVPKIPINADGRQIFRRVTLTALQLGDEADTFIDLLETTSVGFTGALNQLSRDRGLGIVVRFDPATIPEGYVDFSQKAVFQYGGRIGDAEQAVGIKPLSEPILEELKQMPPGLIFRVEDAEDGFHYTNPLDLQTAKLMPGDKIIVFERIPIQWDNPELTAEPAEMMVKILNLSRVLSSKGILKKAQKMAEGAAKEEQRFQAAASAPMVPDYAGQREEQIQIDMAEAISRFVMQQLIRDVKKHLTELKENPYLSRVRMEIYQSIAQTAGLFVFHVNDLARGDLSPLKNFFIRFYLRPGTASESGYLPAFEHTVQDAANMRAVRQIMGLGKLDRKLAETAEAIRDWAIEGMMENFNAVAADDAAKRKGKEAVAHLRDMLMPKTTRTMPEVALRESVMDPFAEIPMKPAARKVQEEIKLPAQIQDAVTKMEWFLTTKETWGFPSLAEFGAKNDLTISATGRIGLIERTYEAGPSALGILFSYVWAKLKDHPAWALGITGAVLVGAGLCWFFWQQMNQTKEHRREIPDELLDFHTPVPRSEWKHVRDTASARLGSGGFRYLASRSEVRAADMLNERNLIQLAGKVLVKGFQPESAQVNQKQGTLTAVWTGLKEEAALTFTVRPFVETKWRTLVIQFLPEHLNELPEAITFEIKNDWDRYYRFEGLAAKKITVKFTRQQIQKSNGLISIPITDTDFGYMDQFRLSVNPEAKEDFPAGAVHISRIYGEAWSAEEQAAVIERAMDVPGRTVLVTEGSLDETLPAITQFLNSGKREVAVLRVPSGNLAGVEGEMMLDGHAKALNGVTQAQIMTALQNVSPEVRGKAEAALAKDGYIDPKGSDWNAQEQRELNWAIREILAPAVMTQETLGAIHRFEERRFATLKKLGVPLKVLFEVGGEGYYFYPNLHPFSVELSTTEGVQELVLGGNSPVIPADQAKVRVTGFGEKTIALWSLVVGGNQDSGLKPADSVIILSPDGVEPRWLRSTVLAKDSLASKRVVVRLNVKDPAVRKLLTKPRVWGNSDLNFDQAQAFLDQTLRALNGADPAVRSAAEAAKKKLAGDFTHVPVHWRDWRNLIGNDAVFQKFRQAVLRSELRTESYEPSPDGKHPGTYHAEPITDDRALTDDQRLIPPPSYESQLWPEEKAERAAANVSKGLQPAAKPAAAQQEPLEQGGGIIPTEEARQDIQRSEVRSTTEILGYTPLPDRQWVYVDYTNAFSLNLGGEMVLRVASGEHLAERYQTLTARVDYGTFYLVNFRVSPVQLMTIPSAPPAEDRVLGRNYDPEGLGLAQVSSVSGQHLRIFQEGNRIYILTQGTNGTSLSGTPFVLTQPAEETAVEAMAETGEQAAVPSAADGVVPAGEAPSDSAPQAPGSSPEVRSEVRSSPDISVVQIRNFSDIAAKILADDIRRLQLNLGKTVNLVLTDGQTTDRIYELLAQAKDIQWERIRIFQSHEFQGIENQVADGQYPVEAHIRRHLLAKLNGQSVPQVFWIRDLYDKEGSIAPIQMAEYTKRLRDLGGADIVVLGIGGVGQIALNEPIEQEVILKEPNGRRKTLASLAQISGNGLKRNQPHLFQGRMHQVELSADSIKAHRPDIRGISQGVKAYTVGIADILEARQIFLFATGSKKAGIVKRTFRGPVSEAVPATALLSHPSVRVVLDGPAASQLYRWTHDAHIFWDEWIRGLRRSELRAALNMQSPSEAAFHAVLGTLYKAQHILTMVEWAYEKQLLSGHESDFMTEEIRKLIQLRNHLISFLNGALRKQFDYPVTKAGIIRFLEDQKLASDEIKVFSKIYDNPVRAAFSEIVKIWTLTHPQLVFKSWLLGYVLLTVLSFFIFPLKLIWIPSLIPTLVAFSVYGLRSSFKHELERYKHFSKRAAGVRGMRSEVRVSEKRLVRREQMGMRKIEPLANQRSETRQILSATATLPGSSEFLKAGLRITSGRIPSADLMPDRDAAYRLAQEITLGILSLKNRAELLAVRGMENAVRQLRKAALWLGLNRLYADAYGVTPAFVLNSETPEEQAFRQDAEFFRDQSGIVAPLVHLDGLANSRVLKTMFEQAAVFTDVNQQSAHHVIFVADNSTQAARVRDAWTEFLQEVFKGSAAKRNKVASRVHMVSGLNDPLIKALLPEGAHTVWVDYSGRVPGAGTKKSEAKFHPAEVADGSRLDLSADPKAFGAALLQATELLLKGARQSGVVKGADGIYRQARADILAGYVQLFEAVRRIASAA